MKPNKKINVHIFFRKAFKFENHSIEKLFKTLIKKKNKDLKFKILVCPFHSRGFFKRLFNCFWAYFNQGDINHISGDVNFISLFLSKNKTINSFMDCYNLRRYSGLKRGILKFFWFYLPIKNSSYITTISNFTKKELINLIKIKKKIQVISAFLPNLNYEIKMKNRTKILIIGTTVNKNLDRIFYAIKGLQIDIIIIGKINKSQNKFLNKNGIVYKNFINISEKKLIDCYNQAKVLLFPSLYEGFGLPIVEAQRMRVPVITSNISPMKEIVNKSALLVNPRNVKDIRSKLKKIINNKNLRKNIVSKGYKNSLKFKPSQYINDYFEIYKKLYQENLKNN